MRTVLPQGSIRWRPVLLIAILITVVAASCGDENESGGELEDAAGPAVVSLDTE